MKRKLSCLLVLLTLAVVAQAQTGAAQSSGSSSTSSISTVLDNTLKGAEKQFVSAADAMPEEKYNFAPTQGEFKGVRTFKQQVTHVAMANYMFGSAILGEKSPMPQTADENGNAANKAEAMKMLKDSFEYAHRAMNSVNAQNATESAGRGTKLGTAILVSTHTMDHYGQVVEYLRMNGIIPPASRQQQ